MGSNTQPVARELDLCAQHGGCGAFSELVSGPGRPVEAVAHLQALEAAEMVGVAAVEKDTRRRSVWLTEKGAQSLQAGLADWKRAHGELAKRLDPEAARRLAIAAEALDEG